LALDSPRVNLCLPAVSILIDPVLINPAKSLPQFAHGACLHKAHPPESRAGGLAPWFARVAAQREKPAGRQVRPVNQNSWNDFHHTVSG
jgi:hypothetical protein